MWKPNWSKGKVSFQFWSLGVSAVISTRSNIITRWGLGGRDNYFVDSMIGCMACQPCLWVFWCESCKPGMLLMQRLILRLSKTVFHSTKTVKLIITWEWSYICNNYSTAILSAPEHSCWDSCSWGINPVCKIPGQVREPTTSRLQVCYASALVLTYSTNSTT